MIFDPSLLGLSDETVVMVPMKVGDIRRALAGEPQVRMVLSPRMAAETFGWYPQNWAAWARGYVEAAKTAPPRFPEVPPPKRTGKGWDLPRQWCQAVYDERMKIAPNPSGRASSAESRLSDRRGNHGPRSRKQPAEQEAAAPPAAPRRLQAVP